MTRLAAIATFGALVCHGGCAGDDTDAPRAVDAATLDAASGADAGDDAAPAGLYAITGDCGELDAELTSADPATFANHLAFDHLYTDDDFDALTAGGQQIILDGNLGGSSLLSEAFAYENLASCEGAALLGTEGEIVYDIDGKKTDFLARIDGLKIGVSVVRAQTFPLGQDLSEAAAQALLEGKLSDIIESSANVAAEDAWTKQILAVIVYNDQHAGALDTALQAISPAIRTDTLVWLTVTDGPDDVLYQ